MCCCYYICLKKYKPQILHLRHDIPVEKYTLQVSTTLLEIVIFSQIALTASKIPDYQPKIIDAILDFLEVRIMLNR